MRGSGEGDPTGLLHRCLFMTGTSFTRLKKQIEMNPPGKRVQDVPPAASKPLLQWMKMMKESERETVLITNTITHRTPNSSFELWNSGQPLCATVR